jgi:hypothetical protein
MLPLWIFVRDIRLAPQSRVKKLYSQQQNERRLIMTTITFQTDGTAQCLYSEIIPLQSIGQLETTRASNIEFHPTKQEWEIRNMQNQLLYSNPSRTACLEWEQKHLS